MSVRRDTSADAMEAMLKSQLAPSDSRSASRPPGAARNATPGPTSRAGATARSKFADDLDEAISVIGLLVGPRTQPRLRKLAGAVTARLKARAAQLRGA